MVNSTKRGKFIWNESEDNFGIMNYYYVRWGINTGVGRVEIVGLGAVRKWFLTLKPFKTMFLARKIGQKIKFKAQVEKLNPRIIQLILEISKKLELKLQTLDWENFKSDASSQWR